MDNVLKKINVDGTLYSIHESKVAESGGTAESLVTTGEKYTWNNKSSFSGSYNDLTDKPTIPTVPTNVSSFTNDAGYLTQHQDISGKANIADISVSVTSTTTSYDANGHDYVEIGGIKWATMNVGANAVTDTGLYFQWGDTQGYTSEQLGSGEGQKYFSKNDYIYYSNYSYTKYNASDSKSTLESSDDAVTAAWGGSWRMPTASEFIALGEAVTSTWTADYQGSGVAGLVCTDKTDSSKVLFFPACGYTSNDWVEGANTNGYCWSSSRDADPSDDNLPLNLQFSNSRVRWQWTNSRFNGLPVRGILVEEQITTTTSVLGTTVLPSEKELWNSKANKVGEITVVEVSADMSNVTCPSTITGNANSGANASVIYKNTGTTTDYTITVSTSYTTTTGDQLELTCPAGGYCEISYANVGGTIYVRGI